MRYTCIIYYYESLLVLLTNINTERIYKRQMVEKTRDFPTCFMPFIRFLFTAWSGIQAWNILSLLWKARNIGVILRKLQLYSPHIHHSFRAVLQLQSHSENQQCYTECIQVLFCSTSRSGVSKGENHKPCNEIVETFIINS